MRITLYGAVCDKSGNMQLVVALIVTPVTWMSVDPPGGEFEMDAVPTGIEDVMIEGAGNRYLRQRCMPGPNGEWP